MADETKEGLTTNSDASTRIENPTTVEQVLSLQEAITVNNAFVLQYKLKVEHGIKANFILGITADKSKGITIQRDGDPAIDFPGDEKAGGQFREIPVNIHPNENVTATIGTFKLAVHEIDNQDHAPTLSVTINSSEKPIIIRPVNKQLIEAGKAKLQNDLLERLTTGDLSRDGLAVLVLNQPDHTGILRLGGKIIIDSRKKVTSESPKGWINPTDFKKMGEIYHAVRTAFTNKTGMNEALLKAIRELGITNATEAIVIGDPPEHWKLERH